MLQGKLCSLRRPLPEDAPSLALHADNINVARWLSDWFPHPYTLQYAEEWIEHHRKQPEPALVFVIDVNGEACGTTGVTLRDDVRRNCCSIGYWLGEAHWGQGLATEAAQIIVDYLFQEMNMNRVEACVYDGNPASGRVLEKAGLAYEATLKKRVFKSGQFLDEHWYALLREDWQPRR